MPHDIMTPRSQQVPVDPLLETPSQIHLLAMAVGDVVEATGGEALTPDIDSDNEPDEEEVVPGKKPSSGVC